MNMTNFNALKRGGRSSVTFGTMPKTTGRTVA